jgi:hypothetical protein
MTAHVVASPTIQVATMSGPQMIQISSSDQKMGRAQDAFSTPSLPNNSNIAQSGNMQLPGGTLAYLNGSAPPLYISAASGSVPNLHFFSAPLQGAHVAQQGFMATDSSGLFQLPHSSVPGMDLSPSHRPCFLSAVGPDFQKGEHHESLYAATRGLNAAAMNGASYRATGLEAASLGASGGGDPNNNHVISMLADYLRAVNNAQRASNSLELLNSLQRQQHLQQTASAASIPHAHLQAQAAQAQVGASFPLLAAFFGAENRVALSTL